MTPQEICQRFGAAFDPPSPSARLGIALATLELVPLNALRHVGQGRACGWYIWGGELSDDPAFFSPLHVSHVERYCATIMPYLALPAGWRVLLAPGQEDAWFDSSLLGKHAKA